MSGVRQAGIGPRVRQAMAATPTATTQAALAKAIGMTEDAMSRSLNGVRAFSSLEIAQIADLLGADVHWLITGEPDPLAATLAARHEYDRGSRGHSNPGDGRDDQTLHIIELAYRQAHPWRQDRVRGLPNTPQAVREALGPGFASKFADTVERELGIDVMCVQGLATDYSLTIGRRPVIVLGAEPYWFRANWSLAHEIAHLALGHHDDAAEPNSVHEAAANAFAAELMLPEAEMRGIDWPSLEESDLAVLLWDWGVSTEAVRVRLESLRLPVPMCLSARPENTTMRLLNRHIGRLATTQPNDFFAQIDPIASRMVGSSQRRLPTFLLSALREGVERHGVNPATLAWLLQVEPEVLEFVQDDPPQSSDLSELEAMLRA